MMPAVVLDRNLVPIVGQVRVLDPTAGLVENRDIDSGFRQTVADQEKPEFGLLGESVLARIRARARRAHR